MSRSRLLALALLAASAGLSGCASPASPVGPQDTRVALAGIMTSDAWDAYEAAEPDASKDGRAGSRRDATSHAGDEPDQDPPFPGPTWTPGRTEVVRWGVRSDVDARPGFEISIEVPAGWEVVDGPTTYSGVLPHGETVFTTTLRAKTPGDWWIPLRIRENGHDYALSVQGRLFVVRAA